jgi:hypothetical protein
MVDDTAVIEGRYYWQLVFNYDNSDNTGDITQTYKYKQIKTVSSRELILNTFKINSEFTYKSETSASVKFEGVGEGSASVEYTIHIDTAYELQKTSETNTTIMEESEKTRQYVIGPGGKLSLYQLHYVTEGVAVEADIFATAPQPDAIVKLKFRAFTRILGLADVLYLFSHTFPESSNKAEWERIRENIVRNSAAPADTQFKLFVGTLEGISPGSSNTREWAGIRSTCSEILLQWDNTDKQLLFKKLVARFSSTVPERENTREWGKIRQLSDEILAGLKELPEAA